jgi:ATP-dependent Lon protease
MQLMPQAPEDLLAAIQSVTSPAALADLTTAYMDLKPEEKQEILEGLTHARASHRNPAIVTGDRQTNQGGA